MKNINKKRRINLCLVKLALFTLQERRKAIHLHCDKGYGYNYGKLCSH